MATIGSFSSASQMVGAGPELKPIGSGPKLAVAAIASAAGVYGGMQLADAIDGKVHDRLPGWAPTTGMAAGALTTLVGLLSARGKPVVGTAMAASGALLAATAQQLRDETVPKVAGKVVAPKEPSVNVQGGQPGTGVSIGSPHFYEKWGPIITGGSVAAGSDLLFGGMAATFAAEEGGRPGRAFAIATVITAAIGTGVGAFTRAHSWHGTKTGQDAPTLSAPAKVTLPNLVDHSGTAVAKIDVGGVKVPVTLGERVGPAYRYHSVDDAAAVAGSIVGGKKPVAIVHDGDGYVPYLINESYGVGSQLSADGPALDFDRKGGVEGVLVGEAFYRRLPASTQLVRESETPTSLAHDPSADVQGVIAFRERVTPGSYVEREYVAATHRVGDAITGYSSQAEALGVAKALDGDQAVRHEGDRYFVYDTANNVPSETRTDHRIRAYSLSWHHHDPGKAHFNVDALEVQGTIFAPNAEQFVTPRFS